MKIDFAKRRRVMERSKSLGHCICDARRPCPCDVLRERNICPCAGERPDPIEIQHVKLMDLVHNAGCASKIAPADLDSVLSRLPAVEDPAVISGLAAADDAAIYSISDTVALVQTVDVFTPCVDDPHLFGKICAANCLSDIYAMGGEPRTALSVLAFPSEKLSNEIIYQMLAGAMQTFKEAGVALIGGHSVKDEEIKLGFAITGVINPSLAASLEKPRPGDVLVLTKPLGTGVLTFSRQIGRKCSAGLAEAEASMVALNKPAAEAMKEAGASACTDITGFGLFAHLRRMLRSSGFGAQVHADALPAFDGVMNALRDGVIPGAIERNREYVGSAIQIEPGVDEAFVNLGFDAQTSGGLLMTVPVGEPLCKLTAALKERGVGAYVIGRILAEPAGNIVLSLTDSEAKQPHSGQSDKSQTRIMQTPANGSESHSPDCCADLFKQTASPAGTAAESQRAFAALMRSVQSAGVLNEKVKELILFSLVVNSRCQPCFEAHYRKALDMGITQSELDESAWCAIAMGGAPVKMFYSENLERMK